MQLRDKKGDDGMDAKLQYPVHEAFYYNAWTDQWMPSAAQDVDALPDPDKNVSLIFPAYPRSDWARNKQKIVWCPNHQRYESWDKNAPEGCCSLMACHCVLDEVPKKSAIIRASGMWRWTILQESLEGDIEIAAEWLSVGWEKKFLWRRMRPALIPVIKIGRASYRIKLTEGQTPEQCGREQRYLKVFPPVIANRLLEIISEGLSMIHNHHILVPQCISVHGMKLNDLLRVIKNPNDVHISFLKNFLGQKIYEELFSKNCTDNYLKLCAYLGIDPPNSVRKEYLKNPFAIVAYFWLVRLGFKDINAIRLFFCPSVIGRTYFNAVWFDSENRLIRNFTLPCTHSGMDFVFYVRWMLRNGKDEMPLAKQIVKLLSEKWERWYDDTLRMFHEYYPFLSEDTKQLVKRRGICGDSHDALIHESYGVDMKRVNIDYQSPMILRLDGNILGFTFHVVTDTSELPVIGRKLSNCVASYASSMSKKQCLIVTASDVADYQACIEVSIAGKNKEGLVDRLRVVQCLGRFNRRLQGDILNACRQWVQQNQIEIGCMDI